MKWAGMKEVFNIITNINMQFLCCFTQPSDWICMLEIIGKTGQWTSQNNVHVQTFFLVYKQGFLLWFFLDGFTESVIHTYFSNSIFFEETVER